MCSPQPEDSDGGGHHATAQLVLAHPKRRGSWMSGAETTSRTPPLFINKPLILAGMEKRATKKMEIGWLISQPSIEDLVIPMILPAHMGTKRFFEEA